MVGNGIDVRVEKLTITPLRSVKTPPLIFLPFQRVTNEVLSFINIFGANLRTCECAKCALVDMLIYVAGV